MRYRFFFLCKICCFEYIFNTIPACVLNRRCLEKVSSNAVILDIASNKSGADYETAVLSGYLFYFSDIGVRCSEAAFDGL